MEINKFSSNSFCFIGDAVYTLYIRNYFINNGYQSSNKLQYLCNKQNSALGQSKVFEYLKEKNFFTDKELEIYKRGRNCIKHIPKNGNKRTYEIASGLEAIVGYLYKTDSNRLNNLFNKIYSFIENNE